MTTGDTPTLPTVSWVTLRVQTGDFSLPVTLTGPKRLVELFHWRRGKASAGVWVIVNAPADPDAAAMPAPEEIDWSLFPVEEAQQEILMQDARCARYRDRIRRRTAA